jgi:hypothetical protein
MAHLRAIGRKDKGVCMTVKKGDNKTSNGNGGGRVKFRYADAERYVDLDMENANAAVADGIKSLASALSGRTVMAPIRALTTPKVAVAPPVDEQEEIQFPPQGQDEHEVEEADSEPPPSGNGAGQKRVYNFKAPKFMDDLDLTKATKPLADYVAEKSPTEMLDKYLVVVVWFKLYLKIDGVKIGHVFTAFSNLGWKSQMPESHSQPLRDLKAKRHFLTFDKEVGYKVNWQGEQHVEKMGAANS